MTADELDGLLQDRLDLSRSDVIAALKLLPARSRCFAYRR